MKQNKNWKRLFFWAVPAVVIGLAIRLSVMFQLSNEHQLLDAKYRRPAPHGLNLTDVNWIKGQNGLHAGEWMLDGQLFCLSLPKRELLRYSPIDGTLSRFAPPNFDPRLIKNGVTFVSLSPDEKTLVCVGNQKQAFLSFDGSRQKLYPQPYVDTKKFRRIYYSPRSVWSDDSKTLIEYEWNQMKTSKITALPLTDKESHFIQFPTRLGPNLMDMLLTGVRDETLWLFKYSFFANVNNPSACDFTLVHLDGRANPVEALRLSPDFSKSTLVREVVLSPQGDRLLWLTENKADDNYIAKFINSVLHKQSQIRLNLWVTDNNGKGVRAIGYEKLGFMQSQTLRGIKWSKDGKKVSFFYIPGTPDHEVIVRGSSTILSKQFLPTELYVLPVD